MNILALVEDRNIRMQRARRNTKGTMPVDPVLPSLEQFLANVPIEEAKKYLEIRNFRGQTALLLCKDIEMLKIIIKYVNINDKCRSGNNALMNIFDLPFELIDVEMIELLLNSGINVNEANMADVTPLMHCCASIIAPVGVTPLMYERSTAINPILYEKFERIVKLLIDRNADPNMQSVDHNKPFNYVIKPELLSPELFLLLQGKTRMNYPKSAMKS